MQLPEMPAAARTLISRVPTGRHLPVVFLALLLSLIFTNHFMFDDDPNRCSSLARSGKYFNGQWVPDGCSTVNAGGGEMNGCAQGRKRKIVLIGDTGLQEKFWELARRMDRELKILDPEPKDLHFSKREIELEYIYDEWLNRTESIHRIEDLRDGKDVKPLITIVGAGKRFVESKDLDGYRSAVEGLTNIAYSGKFPAEAPGSRKTFSQEEGPGDLLLFVPPSVSRPERLDEGPDLADYWLADEKLDSIQWSRPYVSVLWSWQRMLTGRDFNHDMAKRSVDVVLNMRCNSMVYHSPPNSGVCCGKWRTPNWVQVSFLLTGLLILPGAVLFDLFVPILVAKQRNVIRGFAAFCGAISIQYITDRTHIFEQVSKYGWHWPEVGKMLAVAAVFGVVTTTRCKPAGKPSPDGKVPDQPFLPREQTDEWKGWMQICIIIYHYNKGWEATWFWEIIRMSVSSYLFLTGFGHTLYHLQKKDYSFKRFVNVMIRTNLLPCTLAYIMNTRWLLYYYMPLATFWYAVTYATLAVGQKYNDKTWTLLIKIAASALLVNIFISTRHLSETIFRLLAITCRLSFDAKEFFGHRVAQDKYIVYIGMLCGMLFIWIKDVLHSTRRTDSVSRGVRTLFPIIKWTTIIISAIAFCTFWWYLQVHVPSQDAFTALQPYISFIPILTYMVLRNAHPVLRNWHSAAFAYMGRISGEMYVMQDHIWLAGDQELILRTGLFAGDESIWGDRWRDLLLLTPLYLIACSVINDSTGVIATWFLEDKESGPATQTATSEVEIGLLSENGEAGELLGEKSYAKPSIWKRVQLTWPSLPLRVLALLAGMWALNWTYT